MILSLAILCSVAGVGLLRRAWQLGRSNGDGLRLALDGLGWLLLAVSVPLWMHAGGPDRGVAIAFLVFMVPGLAWIALAAWQSGRGDGNGRRRNSRADAVRAAREQARPRRLGLRRAWIFLLAGPVSAAAAVLTGMLVYAGLLRAGWHPADVLATVLLFVPLAWTLLAVAATTHFPLWKRSGVVLAVTVIGLAGYPLLPGIMA